MQPQLAPASSRRRDVTGGQESSRAPRRTPARTAGNLLRPARVSPRHPGAFCWTLGDGDAQHRAVVFGGRSGFAALSSRVRNGLTGATARGFLVRRPLVARRALPIECRLDLLEDFCRVGVDLLI
jgi:hypothetical protein